MNDLFRRAAAIIKCRLEGLAAAAEEPQKILRQAAWDTAEVHDALRVEGREHELTAGKFREQAEERRQVGIEWEKRAMQAARAGQDALATEALRWKGESLARADALEAERVKAEQLVKTIWTTVTVLQSKRATALAFARIFSALELPSFRERDPAPVFELLALLEERALAIESS